MLLDDDPVARVPVRHAVADLGDATGVLVAQGHRRVALEFIVENVQVRPAHPAGSHLDDNPARPGYRLWHLF